LGVVIAVVYRDPNIIHEYKDMGAQSFEDIIDWGKQKLDPNTTRLEVHGKKGAFKNFEDILRETDERIADKDNDDEAVHVRTPTISPVDYDNIEPESDVSKSPTDDDDT